MIKKRKYENYNEINERKTLLFQKNILFNTNSLPINVTQNYINVNTNSWFDIHKYDSITKHKKIHFNKKIEPEILEKSISIKIIPNNIQKQILQSWFRAHTDVYNEGVKYIKNNFNVFKNDITFDKLIGEFNQKKTNSFDDFYFIRSKLYNEKQLIQSKSQLEHINKNTKIYIHTLDYALKQLCSNIKSAKSNLLQGNIKKFRIKYW